MENKPLDLFAFYAECLQSVCGFDERMNVVAAGMEFERGLHDSPLLSQASDIRRETRRCIPIPRKTAIKSETSFKRSLRTGQSSLCKVCRHDARMSGPSWMQRLDG